MRRQLQRGVTLVELIISIVVISLAVSAVLGVLSQSAAHSADAMIMAQAVSTAEAYLEEIALKPFADPDGVASEANRVDFDDIVDYDSLVDYGARDQFGNAIAGLSGYTVTVTVTSSSGLAGVPATDVLRIDVRVAYPPLVDLTLSGYRTRT